MSQKPGEPPSRPLFAGFSEFGAAIAGFVEGEPSARGAILTDVEGDPIDFAHYPAEVSALDLQIAGAQVEQTTTRVTAWCARQNLGPCEILIEASHGLILSASPGHGCVLSALHRREPTDEPTPEQAPRDDRPRDPPQPGEPIAAEAPAGARDPIDPDALLAAFAALRARIGALIA